MTRAVDARRWIVTALLVASSAGAGSGQAPAATGQAPVFRASVDLVSVAAIVRDRRGQVVRDLVRDDFQVFDNGVRRPIVEFTPSDDGPISLALLVDVSGSMVMASGLASARAWVGMLLDRLRPGMDEVALFSFDRELRQQHPFDLDLGAVRAALSTLQPFGATSLYDAIGDTAQRLAARDHKRRAILVLTDGLDNGSRLTPAQVSGLASATDVPVYVLAVLSPVDLATVGSGLRQQNPAGALANLAAWTGGSAFVVTSPAQASVATQKMLSDLRHQYLLAFEAAGPAGWRALDIRVRRRELTIRARSGYFVTPPLG